MKKRIKDIPVSTNEFCNDFYNMYGRQIEYFTGERKEESVFVADKELEKQVSELINNRENMIVYFVGKAGVGKTSFLKNIFHVTDNNVNYNDDKHMICLMIGFRGVLSESNPSGFIINSITRLCTSLEKEFGFREQFYSEAGHIAFYEYIEVTKGSLLEHVSTTELIGKSELDEKMFRLKAAEKNDPYTYTASRLKFYLNYFCKEIENIIILLDDLEALKADLHPTIVRNALAFFSCMLNVPGDEKKQKTKLFLSMQDSTFEKLLRREEVSSYAPYTILHKSRPVDMIEFFQKKKEKVWENEENIKIWDDAYGILSNFANRFDQKYSIVIKNICNYDFQLMKKCYKRILTNRVWLLRGERRRDFLSMSTTDNLFNNISVVRSIACGNNDVYRGEKSIFIPNVLLNDEFNDDSIVALLVLSYFDRNFNRNGSIIKRQKLRDVFERIFSSNACINSSLDRVLRHFINCKILYNKEYIEREGYLERGEYLEITPRGTEIWKMLVTDSVLLEMYREDYYFDEEKSGCNFISSRKIMTTIGQYEIFLQLLNFINELLSLEKRVHKSAAENNMLAEYYTCFGEKAQAKRLLEGVIKSIEYSGNIYNTDIINEKERLERNIKRIDDFKEEVI